MTIFLKNKLFRMFLTSSSFGSLGRTLFDIAFVIYATTLPNATLAVSIVSIITTLPYAISFIQGYFADKTKNKINGILLTRFSQALLFVIFAIVTIFNVSWYVFLVLVLINIVADIYWVVIMVIYH